MNRLYLAILAVAAACIAVASVVWWARGAQEAVSTAQVETATAKAEAAGAKQETAAAVETVRVIERTGAAERIIIERVVHARESIQIAFGPGAEVGGVVLAWADGVDGLRQHGLHDSGAGEGGGAAAGRDSGDSLHAVPAFGAAGYAPAGIA